MFKILFIVFVVLAVGINLFAFIAEKVMKKRINKIAREQKTE